MEIFSKLVYALMLLSALGVIVLVLLQHGKGADMGTGFGAGASGSLFGATGSANFLSRLTAGLATTFFASTLALSWVASHHPQAPAAAPTIELPTLPVQKGDNSSAVPPAQPPVQQQAPAAPANKAGEIPK